MDITNVLNARIKERGITVSELSRRIGMNDELLRRSLAGTRNVKADEFIGLCRELSLDIEDFVVPAMA